MPEFGPFSVDPGQVAGLSGADFAGFVGMLLDAERARASLEGAALTVTHRTNAPDGGVDAELRRAEKTAWIPEGRSAWQFKAGDLGPDSCKSELRSAEAAKEILRAGGKYRLVLGKSITPTQIDDRREALEVVARELGVDITEGQIEVLNGDALARWAQEFPAIARSPIISGFGHVGLTFDEWANSVSHNTTWIESDARTRQIEDLRHAIENGDESGIHVEGVSGLGKTRLVMEALRGTANEVLTVYVPSEDQFQPVVLSRLHHEGRTAVVVIDECDSRRHDVFAGMLQVGTKIRLVTISQPSGASTRSPVLSIGPFDDDSLLDLILTNEPGLWSEAARVIVEVSSGNIDYALKCAKLLVAQRSGSAHALVTPEDIRQFIDRELPAGALFLASCALALFTRVGFDGELANELKILATGLDIPEANLRSAAFELGRADLLESQGRYRSVGPHPVAIHLAERGWSAFGSSLLTRLFPLLSDSMIERLFARAAQIGDRALPAEVVDRLIGQEGVLSSLDAVSEDSRGRLLTNLAILSPERVTSRIADLISGASDEQLEQAVGARRPLVGALQKLAWHSSTFWDAADSLLRLATVENESYSNNSTGEWVDLFGAMLPTTAASPDMRIRYLQKQAASDDKRVRLLVVKAASRAITYWETAPISGELQGGFVVERRGLPATYGDLWAYQNAAIDLLTLLARDADPEVASGASQALADGIQGLLEVEPVRDHLAAALATLSSPELRDVRVKIAGLRSLYARADPDPDVNRDAILHGIEAVADALPAASIEDSLWTLLHEPAWDRSEGAIESDLKALLSELQVEEARRLLMSSLGDAIPTDYNVGHYLSSEPSAEVEAALVQQVDGANPRAFLGYLVGREEREPGAYDSLVDGQQGLDGETRLRLTTLGPRTEAATRRVAQIVPSLSVAQGARALSFWTRDLSDDELVADYLLGWAARMTSQEDYNALIDFLSLRLHNRSQISPELEDAISRIVAARRIFPEVGRQDYHWGRLASRQLAIDPSALVGLLADLLEQGVIGMYSTSSERGLLREALAASDDATWCSLMDRVAARRSFALGYSTRGWLAEVVEVDVARRWVGSDVERARVLAATASVAGSILSPAVAFLVENFGGDDQVRSSLYSNFVSGSWTGNESARIQGQIDRIRQWADDAASSPAIRRWCRQMVEHLEANQAQALQREQEEFF